MNPFITDRKIPAGWTHSPLQGDGFGVAHESIHFELQAEPVEVRANRPKEAQWELELVHQIKDEYRTSYPLGYVATKEEAINQITYLMQKIDDEIKELESIQMFDPQDFISHLDIETYSATSFEDTRDETSSSSSKREL